MRWYFLTVCWASLLLPAWGCDSDSNDDDNSADEEESTDSQSSQDEAPGEPRFEMHVVDVGSGLAVFLKGPDFAMVYDAGSSDDMATGSDNRFVAYLRAVSPDMQSIDHVVLSHPHEDHMTLLPDVIGMYEVGDIWDSGMTSSDCAYQAFLMAASESNARYHSAVGVPGTRDVPLEKPCGSNPAAVTLSHDTRIAPGLTVALGNDAKMVFLHANEEPADDPNDNSLVIRVDLGDKRLLLMGDAHAGEMRDPSEPPDPGSVEADLLEDASQLDADVLLVGYHGYRAGSRTAFLEAVSPEVSIIPSAPLFAPPDEAVIEALESFGPVFRTDVDDAACASDTAKIGPDSDGKPGGCSNVRVTIHDTGEMTAEYSPIED
jgi:beta-lactamase superfamily II metal-dependent hydrolase